MRNAVEGSGAYSAEFCQMLLEDVPVLGGVKKELIQYLVENAPVRTLIKGDCLFREGDTSQCMYIIISGRIAVSKAWQSTDYLLKELVQGDCVGEMALFDLFPRSAAAVALESTSVMEISSSMLLNLYERDLEQFTLIQMNMGREVTRRLREADRCLFRHKMEAQVVDGAIISG